MRLRDIVLSSLLAVCVSGCGIPRHYKIDNFDGNYSCEEQFSKDFNSDEITLYKSGKKVAVRKHKVTKNHEGNPEHSVFYEFYDGNKKIAETSPGKPWIFTGPITDYNVFSNLYLHFYKMQWCEKLLQESKN